MYRQADWLMGEAGRIQHIEQVRKMVGEHTRLITCMAQWNGQDPTRAVPEAVEAGVGLYGFRQAGWGGHHCAGPHPPPSGLRPEDPKDAGPRSFRMANGQIALGMTFEGERKIIAGKLEGQLDLGKPWGEEEFLTGGKPASPVPLKEIQVSSAGEALEIAVPAGMTDGNPVSLVIEWGNAR